MDARPLALPLLLLLVAAAAPPAAGQSVGTSPLLDLIEIQRLGRDVIAYGASGGEVRERLHIGERVLWSGSRGQVGVVVTDQRVLAVGTQSSDWQERRYERDERAPAQAQLGDRIALVTTSRRALGFHPQTAELLEYRLGPQETLRTSGVGEQVGVVVTSRNALGLSPVRGAFQEQDLQVGERIEVVDAGSSLATVRTSQRMLVFSGATGSWSERRREVHDR